MTYDAHVPVSLKKIQEWFASIITRPIDMNSQMKPLSPSGVSMDEEANLFLLPSPTLRPAQRIQIYNQQYWWRLLTVLQEAFPLVTSLFGYVDFNQKIATPYLEKHPPTHWSLNHLGEDLNHWIEKNYQAPDKNLIQNAVALDWAYNEGFFKAQYPPIDKEALLSKNHQDPQLEKKIYLQPYLYLFKFPYDLFTFRSEILKQNPEYWEENDFPKLMKGENFHFILFRNRESNLSWDTLSPTAFAILQLFKNGSTLDEVCDWIEWQKSEIQEEAASEFHLWFQSWTAKQLLTLQN